MFAENAWSFDNIGIITDDFANEYFGGTTYTSGWGFIRYNYIKIEDFPKEADRLNIVYDAYKRHYEFHFDLKGAKKNV